MCTPPSTPNVTESNSYYRTNIVSTNIVSTNIVAKGIVVTNIVAAAKGAGETDIEQQENRRPTALTH